MTLLKKNSLFFLKLPTKALLKKKKNFLTFGKDLASIALFGGKYDKSEYNRKRYQRP